MKPTLKTRTVILVCSLLLTGCNPNSTTRDEAKIPPRDETQLVRTVAEDFLMVTGGAGSYWDLRAKAAPFATEKFLKWYSTGHAWYRFQAWSILSQSINSNATEATVRGSLQATYRWYESPSTNNASGLVTTTVGENIGPVGFRLRLVKEQRRWLVDSIEYVARPLDSPTAALAGDATRSTWEYKVVSGRLKSELENVLELAGADSWELVSVVPAGETAYAIMRRPKK